MIDRQPDINRIQQALQSEGISLNANEAYIIWESYSKRIQRYSWFPLPKEDQGIIDIVKFEAKCELNNQLSLKILTQREKQAAYDKLITQKRILEESNQEMV